MFISKTKLLMAVLVVALVVPAAAYATDAWDDTADGKFYHDPVAWAKANGMTTGCDGGTNFCPDRGVTRGENITFAKRYDDLVQVWLADIQADADAAQAAADTNAADIAARDPYYVGVIELDGTEFPRMTLDNDGCVSCAIGYNWDATVDLVVDDFVHVDLCRSFPADCVDLSVGFVAQVTVLDQNGQVFDEDVIATTYFPGGANQGELWIKLFDAGNGILRDDDIDIHLVIWKLL